MEQPTGLYDYLPRTILRKGYTRKAYRRKTGKTVRGSRVKASHIRDVGAPGKRRAPGIGKLKPGLMKAVGYDVSAPTSRRHAAVDKAVKKYGRNSTIRKLNAVAVYTRRTSPAKSRTFKSDMKYVQTKYS
jgi:hypothetical protein